MLENEADGVFVCAERTNKFEQISQKSIELKEQTITFVELTKKAFTGIELGAIPKPLEGRRSRSTVRAAAHSRGA